VPTAAWHGRRGRVATGWELVGAEDKGAERPSAAQSSDNSDVAGARPEDEGVGHLSMWLKEIKKPIKGSR